MKHRKTIRHFHEPGHLHELTFSCYRRMPLLTNDPWRNLLARSIDAANIECDFQLVAFVFMPEHVHLLVYPAGRRANFGLYLARVKQPVAKEVKQTLAVGGSRLLEQLTIRLRPGKYGFRFWQEGPGFDRNLFSSEAIAASIDYIHQNPVKRKLCDQAVDWRWSSARHYHHCDPLRAADDELPRIDGLPAGSL